MASMAANNRSEVHNHVIVTRHDGYPWPKAIDDPQALNRHKHIFFTIKVQCQSVSISKACSPTHYSVMTFGQLY